MTKKKYQEYLSSFWWGIVRERMLELYPECQRCGFPYEINVHHKTYKRLGAEKIPNDLEVLCRACHSRHHFIENISDAEIEIGGGLDKIKERLSAEEQEAKEKNYQRNAELRANKLRDEEL